MTRLFIQEFIQPPKEARWIGFKEIRYPSVGDKLPKHLAFMRRTFPNAHFVFNSRSGEKVSQSKWFRSRNPDDVKAMIVEMDARFADYAANNPDHAKHVFYEDLIADPAALAPVFAMLGEPMDLEALKSVLNVKLMH
jgi:hypothetical protein